MIRSAPLPDDGLDLVPEIIVGMPLQAATHGLFTVRRGTDDLDGYEGIDLVTENDDVLALRRYDGHPADTFTIYADSTIPAERVTGILDEVLQTFGVSEPRLLWHRRLGLDRLTGSEDDGRGRESPAGAAPAREVRTLDDLFFHTLEDMLAAELRISRIVGRMMVGLESASIGQVLRQHRDQATRHAENLAEIIRNLGKEAIRRTSPAIDAMAEEIDDIFQDIGAGDVRDAAMAAGARAFADYAVARYGTLAAWARQLGREEATGVLEQMLEDEKRLSSLLVVLDAPAATSRRLAG